MVKLSGGMYVCVSSAGPVQVRCRSGASPVQVQCRSGAGPVQVRCRSGAGFAIGFRGFAIGFRVFPLGFRVFALGFRVFALGFRVLPSQRHRRTPSLRAGSTPIVILRKPQCVSRVAMDG